MSILAKVDREMPILVVDDISTMRRIMKDGLRQLGFTNITEAANGSEALSKLQAGDFHFIVSDFDMPNMMGTDLLKAVRADESLKSLPFLMVTVEAEKEKLLDAAKAGLSNFIIKPFSVDTLSTKIEAILQKHQ